MIEWQNESSLFVIRIQGKQWYWVYKYNSDTNYRLQNVYWNVGNNNWYKTSNQGTINFNVNNSTLIYIYEYEFKKTHKAILDKYEKTFKYLNNNSYNTQSNQFTFQKHSRLSNFEYRLFLKHLYFNMTSPYLDISIDPSFFKKVYEKSQGDKILSWDFTETRDVGNDYDHLINLNEKSVYNVLSTDVNSPKSYYEYDRLEDVEETLENLRTKVSNFPVKLIKGVLNKHNISLLNSNTTLNKNILFSYRLNNDQIVDKISQIEQFWGFRQKKYKKLRSFFFSQNSRYSNRSYQPISNFVNNENFNKYNLYTGIKNNKSKNEMIPVTLARRLLRTKRTLVLPAHINITIITSSYDVVHSWFVPGLGLKIDCVPGRSNHLTLYIDNVGFYYGQCAEICGRYHHHMPIRVCALNYEHFLLWWQTKGLPRMYRSQEFMKKKSVLLNKFKY